MPKPKSEPKAKFLLFASEVEGSEELKKEIESSGIGDIEKVRSLDLARTQVSSGEVQGLILNLKIFSLNEVKLVDLFYALNNNIMIIVVSRQIDEAAYSKVKDLKHVVLLQRPFREAKVIALFCKKMITGRETFRREHFRYMSNQHGSIEVLSNKNVHMGNIVNISRGGALFESDHDMNLVDHEIVRLGIQLSEINKIHIMTAEIVWISPFDPKTKKMSIGLKFLGSKELVNALYNELKEE
jgi:predicted SpoU family rRNA methylase